MFSAMYGLPPIFNLSPFLFRQPEGDFSPPSSLPLSSPLVRGGHGCGTPGFSSIPIVGEGHCPSRDVTPDTEVRWFYGITGGSMPRPYNGAAETVWFSLCTNFLLYPTCRRSSSVSPKGISLPPASVPLSSPLVRGGYGCGNPSKVPPHNFAFPPERRCAPGVLAGRKTHSLPEGEEGASLCFTRVC